MKKSLLYLLIVLTLTLTLNGCFLFKVNQPKTLSQLTEKSTKEDKLSFAKYQVDNYFKYQTPDMEKEKLVRLTDKDIYYYAANNKHYFFPNIDIYKTWFKNYEISNIKLVDKEEMYKTTLGGNVTLRPGTLMMTETDPKIYLITGSGQMKIFGNLTLLEKLYGKNYKDYIVSIPNFFFTQYQNQGAINQPEEFPEILPNITINTDKGL